MLGTSLGSTAPPQADFQCPSGLAKWEVASEGESLSSLDHEADLASAVSVQSLLRKLDKLFKGISRVDERLHMISEAIKHLCWMQEQVESELR